jgi:hypothetical protein
MRTQNDISVADLLHASSFLKSSLNVRNELLLSLLGFEMKFGYGFTMSGPAPTVYPFSIKSHEVFGKPTITSEPTAKTEIPQTDEQPLDENSEDFLVPDEYLVNDATDVAQREGNSLPEFDTEKHSKQLPYLEPLFDGKYSRSLIFAVGSIVKSGKKIDIRKISDQIASGRIAARIPFLPARQVCREINLLIDIGEGMEPFSRDAEEIAKEMEKLMGKETMKILFFRNCPLDEAGSDTIDTWKTYNFPEAGKPIVILTDLGCAPTSASHCLFSIEQWNRYLQKANMRGCQVTALIPYNANRWPRQLINKMRIVRWDRNTKVRDIFSKCLKK